MNRYSMHQHPSEQLMTVEEAERLSTLDGYEAKRRDERRRKPVIWAWQTVEGVLAQTVSEEQIDRMMNGD